MKVIKVILSFFKYIFVILLVILSVAPFLWVLVSSFESNAEILSSSIGLPQHFKIENYRSAFRFAPIARFYINSVIVGILGTLLNLVILGMAAYVIARFEFKGKRLLISVFSLSLLIPGAALLLPLYKTINMLGLYDSLNGLIIVYAGFGLPTTLYILASYFLTIPKELEEAACLDGAGFIKTFTQIILPISMPGFSTAGVLQFLGCWNELQFAITLTTGNKSRTLPLALYYFKSQFASDYGAMFAVAIIVIIPSIIVYILMQEQVVSGLVAGSVKS